MRILALLSILFFKSLQWLTGQTTTGFSYLFPHTNYYDITCHGMSIWTIYLTHEREREQCKGECYENLQTSAKVTVILGSPWTALWGLLAYRTHIKITFSTDSTDQLSTVTPLRRTGVSNQKCNHWNWSTPSCFWSIWSQLLWPWSVIAFDSSTRFQKNRRKKRVISYRLGECGEVWRDRTDLEGFETRQSMCL